MRLGIILAVGILSGCAGSTWYHPNYVTQASADRQFKIDSGYCTAVSRSGGPAYIPVPATGSQTALSGTATTYGPSGPVTTRYDGYATTTPRGNAFSGFANGYNIGNAIGARMASQSVYDGCMMSRGWTQDREETQSVRDNSEPYNTVADTLDVEPIGMGIDEYRRKNRD